MDLEFFALAYTQQNGRIESLKIAVYLAEKREGLKPTKTFKPDLDSSAARILSEAIKNQRL